MPRLRTPSGPLSARCATVSPVMNENPYASYLGLGDVKKDARAVLSSTPGLLHQVACTLSPERIETPIAPGKWSPRQIIAHLADCELALSFRLRQTLASPAATPALLQPFDQDAWARHYDAYDLPAALEVFRAARGWNLKLIGSLSQADLSREAFHPERGPLTVQLLLETSAGHDLHHLGQLQQVRAAVV